MLWNGKEDKAPRVNVVLSVRVTRRISDMYKSVGEEM